jgi:hypothetical protein
MGDIELTKEDHRIIHLALKTIMARAYGFNYPHTKDEINDVLKRLKISGTQDRRD